jgi:hypothetical protein
MYEVVNKKTIKEIIIYTPNSLENEISMSNQESPYSINK